jgi:hypothetical protein
MAGAAVLAVAVAGLALWGFSRYGMSPPKQEEITGKSPATSAKVTAAGGASAVHTASTAIGAAGVTTGWGKGEEIPPAWVERDFVTENGSVLLVGHGAGASVEAAVSGARGDALLKLTRHLYSDLAGSPAHTFTQARLRDEIPHSKQEPITTRLLAQVGAFATPERVESISRKTAAGVEAYARYRLPQGGYDQALALYKETVTFQGLTVGRFFPLLEASFHADGELLVLATQARGAGVTAGLRAGDAVLKVDGRSVTAVDGFRQMVATPWAALPVSGAISMEIESLGARRSVQLHKLTPNP